MKPLLGARKVSGGDRPIKPEGSVVRRSAELLLVEREGTESLQDRSGARCREHAHDFVRLTAVDWQGAPR